jgi:alkylated DNA repair dioxygenase AlkB
VTAAGSRNRGPVVTVDPSVSIATLFDDIESEGDPRLDSSFASATRLQLDETTWIDHVPGWLTGDRTLMQALMAEAEWEQRSRWMFTRQVEEPRLTAEYPTIAQAPQPFVREIAAVLSEHYERDFTRLWMNWYRDHEDGTGWHADRPANKHADAVIPVLSLGATRRFLIRPYGGGPSRALIVHGGDLVVMGGRCQRDYQHSVPKQRHATGPRVSLNFSSIHAQDTGSQQPSTA